MRILMVTNTYAPAPNGVATLVRTLVHGLSARGHEVEVLTARLKRRAVEERVHEVPSVRGFAPDFPLPVLLGIPPSLRGRDFDVVHIHHPVLLGPLGLRIAERCGARKVFTAHSVYTDYLDYYGLGIGRTLKGAAAARFTRVLDRCDLVLAPSTHVSRVMRSWGVASRIVRMDAPPDIACPPRAEARGRLGISAEARVVLSVGRLAPEKRFDTVLREFAQVERLVPTARLAIAGDGPQRLKLQRLATRLGIDDRETFLGELPHERLADWYAAADVLACASLSETGPMTVVEAMSCGTPTVAYAAPGYEDRIATGDNGILVEPRDGELAAAIASVLTDSRVSSALRAGAAARAAELTPAQAVEQLLGYYGELLIPAEER